MDACRQIECSGPADRLKILDGWRGMAILFVLVGHFSVYAPPGLARAGVDCFFVLSGRLMAEILIVRRIPLGRFIARRVSRIVPALAVFVLIMLVALLAAPGFASAERSLLGAAGAMFFFHNYIPADQVLPFFEHSWSLAVEEHSYLLLAAIVLITARKPRTTACAALLLAIAGMANGLLATSQGNADGLYPYWRTDVRAASILLSFGLWILLEPRLPKLKSQWLEWLGPVSLLAGLSLHLAGAPDRLCFTLGTALLAVAVVTIDRARPAMLRLLESPVPVWLGLVSFSLYLWQQPLYVASRNGAPILLCLAIAFGCALWSFHAVEGPARTRLNRAFARPRVSPAGALGGRRPA